MEKVDFKKKLKHLYTASAKKVDVVTVPKMNYLMVDGKGDPNEGFPAAAGSLFGIAFCLKFMFKKMKKPKGYYEYTMPPLESLWWSASGKFDIKKISDWRWTVLLMQPDYIDVKLKDMAIEQLMKKREEAPLRAVRLESFDEGLCAQSLHIGSYMNEAPTIEKILSAIKDSNHTPHGKHHEIYLNDPHRIPEAKLKTILRYPIKKK
ncbi:MAG TPA: GyrI-like domain-containing protein [Bacteroidota bacterium]|nr:GyrI-like domain-containing protein [Bacteroidota bacterium]